MDSMDNISGLSKEQIAYKYGLEQTMFRLTGTDDTTRWTVKHISLIGFMTEFGYNGLGDLIGTALAGRLTHITESLAASDWVDNKQGKEPAKREDAKGWNKGAKMDSVRTVEKVTITSSRQ